jgi:hypothetical protein
MQKAIGIAFTIVGILLASVAFSLWNLIGLFLATIASLPGFLILFYGYSLYSKGGFKRAIGHWLVLTVATLLLWSIILLPIYQIILLVAVMFFAASVLLWYLRKRKLV